MADHRRGDGDREGDRLPAALGGGRIDSSSFPNSPPDISTEPNRSPPPAPRSKNKIQMPDLDKVIDYLTPWRKAVADDIAEIKKTRPPTTEAEIASLQNKERFLGSIDGLIAQAEEGLADPNTTWFRQKFPRSSRVYDGMITVLTALEGNPAGNVGKGDVLRFFKGVLETASLMREEYLKGLYGDNYKEKAVKEFKVWEEQVRKYYKKYERQVAAEKKVVEQQQVTPGSLTPTKTPPVPGRDPISKA